ncbi:MAG: AbgT family transporter [Acetobacteraceae bacterium]
MSEVGESARDVGSPRGEAPSFTQRVLDAVERFGNKVPHPVMIFVILIGFVIVLSHILWLFGAKVSYDVINPQTDKLEHATTAARSLLSIDGVRFMYTGCVPNLMGFTALGVIIVAMVGVGTVITLMLPYVIVIAVVWTILLLTWQIRGIPWGL